MPSQCPSQSLLLKKKTTTTKNSDNLVTEGIYRYVKARIGVHNPEMLGPYEL